MKGSENGVQLERVNGNAGFFGPIGVFIDNVGEKQPMPQTRIRVLKREKNLKDGGLVSGGGSHRRGRGVIHR